MRKAQLTRRTQAQIAEDSDKIVRIEKSQDGEKTHVAVHKLDENLQAAAARGRATVCRRIAGAGSCFDRAGRMPAGGRSGIRNTRPAEAALSLH